MFAADRLVRALFTFHRLYFGLRLFLMTLSVVIRSRLVYGMALSDLAELIVNIVSVNAWAVSSLTSKDLHLPSLSATQETASLSTPHYRVFAT